MSGAQTSPFPNQNELMQANAQQLANYYAPERNRLFIEDAKQQIAGRETEMMARASQGLLGLGDEAKMAAAYPETVRYLQSQGYAKNAPLAFPGKAVLERMVSFGIPAEKQYEQAGVRTAATAFTNSLTGNTGTAAGGPAAPAGTAPGVIPPAPELAPIVAPGGAKFSVAAPYADRFRGLVADLEAEGYKIDPGTSGGYNPRVIAGTNTPSEHSHGAAVDINWGRNARGSAGDIPPELARRLAAKYGLTWGGDWEGETRDPMHFEVAAANRGAAPVRGVAARTGGTDVASAGTTAAPQLAAPALINPLSSPAAVASIGAPPAPGSVAAQTAGLVVPQGATPQPGVAAPAPAPTAPTPAPGAPAAVLPPLPPAPLPTIGNTGLTADQITTLKGKAANARTPQQIAELHADAQTYRQQNVAANEKHEQAVYARTEKAQADRRADAAAAETVKQHGLEEAHRQAEFARNQANDHLAQVQRDFTNGHTTEAARRAAEAHAAAMAKAASDAADAANPYHGKDHNSAILWRGNQTGGDTSTQEYADAYRAKKFQTAPNGSVVEVELPWKPPTGPNAATATAKPKFIAQPSDTARNEVRKVDNDAVLITSAMDRYLNLHDKQGGGSWDAFWSNPTSPEAQRLLGAFDVMKTTLRSPAFYNTGVLQPAEMELLKQDLISPQTLRGVFATPEAMKARLGEIKMAILMRQDQELRSIGLPGSMVRNDKEYDALPPGATFYDKDGHKRQKPEAN